MTSFCELNDPYENAFPPEIHIRIDESGRIIPGDSGELPPHIEEGLAMLAMALAGAHRVMNSPKEGYEVFNFEREQEEVYEYSMGIAGYVLDNAIGTVVLVDRAARPMYVGVRECLKAVAGPGDEMPDFKFINPKGFRAKEDLPRYAERKVQGSHYHRGDRKEKASQRRKWDEIRQEFRQTHQAMLSKKDQGVLLLDTCIHKGGTILPVINMFHEEGVTNLHFGVVHDTAECLLPPTFSLTPFRPEGGCTPFHEDMMVEKTYASTYSVPTKSEEKRATGIIARREIRQIVRDRLQRDGLLPAPTK